jgi:hypothetical protein
MSTCRHAYLAGLCLPHKELCELDSMLHKNVSLLLYIATHLDLVSTGHEQLAGLSQEPITCVSETDRERVEQRENQQTDPEKRDDDWRKIGFCKKGERKPEAKAECEE